MTREILQKDQYSGQVVLACWVSWSKSNYNGFHCKLPYVGIKIGWSRSLDFL